MDRWFSPTFSAIADQLTADWAILLEAMINEKVKYTGKSFRHHKLIPLFLKSFNRLGFASVGIVTASCYWN
jgi:hypothetical protein